jgi:hypothetical protein
MADHHGKQFHNEAFFFAAALVGDLHYYDIVFSVSVLLSI